MNSSPQGAFVVLVRHIILKPMQSLARLKTAWTADLGKSGVIYYGSGGGGDDDDDDGGGGGDDDDDDDDESNKKYIPCLFT
jgi:hypothetical protein